MLSSGRRITAQASDIYAMAHVRKGLQQANAMIQLHRGAVKVPILEQMVHTYADLQDAFVQVANLVGRGTPQQLKCLVLLEKLA
jgi:hypothetical protein